MKCRLNRIASALWSMLLMGVMAVNVSAAEVADGICGDNLTWKLDNRGQLTISGTGEMADYCGDDVTDSDTPSGSAAPWAAHASEIRQVVLTEGVTGIGDFAFYNCAILKDINIPDSVISIGAYAFNNCWKNLREIALPDSVEVIGEYAFAGCSRLKHITLPGNLKRISNRAFENCTYLTGLRIPANVSYIGEEAFWGCYQGFVFSFEGDAPEFSEASFSGISGSASYPAGNKTWTEAVLRDYGGNIVWNSEGGSETADRPAAPFIWADNVLSSGKTRISWNEVDGAKKYEVYRSATKEGNYSLLKTIIGTSLARTSVSAGEFYYYKVCAVDVYGTKSLFSNIVSRTCDLPQPVQTVGNVAASGKIRISWKAIKDAMLYEVYRSVDGENWIRLAVTAETGVTDTDAAVGKVYYYKVRAIHNNYGANSAYSAVKYRACDLPRPNVTVTLNSSGKPRLSWDAVEGAEKYEIYRSTSKDGEYTKLSSTTETAVTNSKVVAGKTYYYKVRAIHSSSAANSAYSTVKSIQAK